MRVAVIGAGIYGLHVARLLGGYGHQVDVFEKEVSGMQVASKLNQARVHGGYHYPRSLQTAARSQKNYVKFISEYSSCIDIGSKAIYGIAKDSKVSPEKFWQLSKMISAPIKPASKKESELFNSKLIVQAFVVKECAFNSELVLNQLLQRMPTTVSIYHNQKIRNYNIVKKAENTKSEIYIVSEIESFGPYDLCVNATYGELTSNESFSDKLVYEVCELMHVKTPQELENLAITVIDGPFFSLTPWPVLGEKVLTHVRFTPHAEYTSYKDAQQMIDTKKVESRFGITIRDCERFLPIAREIKHLQSKYVVKTILSWRDFDDARPILAGHNAQILHLVGSKVDNIYDVDEVVLNFLRGNSHY